MKILKFGKPDCSGCKIMGPRFDEIERQMPELDSVFINIDEDTEMAQKYQVKQSPTFIIIDDQENELDRRSGIIEKDEVVDLIKKYQNR